MSWYIINTCSMIMHVYNLHNYTLHIKTQVMHMVFKDMVNDGSTTISP